MGLRRALVGILCLVVSLVGNFKSVGVLVCGGEDDVGIEVCGCESECV